MRPLSHRRFLTGSAATAAAVAAQAPGPRRRAPLVPHADLMILDPIWATASLTPHRGYLISDTLFVADERLRVTPQMVERWSVSDWGLRSAFTPRNGLRGDDGQPVGAEALEQAGSARHAARRPHGAGEARARETVRHGTLRSWQGPLFSR